MIDVATLSVIRRWALREQLSIREIARRTGLSRNTIRKYLRSDTKAPQYRPRASSSVLDPFAEKLAGWLKTETSKSRKQRRTLKQIHEDLKELGFEGSYDRVAAFARTWREGQTERVNPASKRTLHASSPRVEVKTTKRPLGRFRVRLTSFSRRFTVVLNQRIIR